MAGSGTKNTTVNKRDRLFQKTILANNPISLLGGKTEVVHHFISKGAGGDKLRWYEPNGIPLTNAQHQAIHGKYRKEYEDRIIAIKGQAWLNDLYRQLNQNLCQK